MARSVIAASSPVRFWVWPYRCRVAPPALPTWQSAPRLSARRSPSETGWAACCWHRSGRTRRASPRRLPCSAPLLGLLRAHARCSNAETRPWGLVGQRNRILRRQIHSVGDQTVAPTSPSQRYSILLDASDGRRSVRSGNERRKHDSPGCVYSIIGDLSCPWVSSIRQTEMGTIIHNARPRCRRCARRQSHAGAIPNSSLDRIGEISRRCTWILCVALSACGGGGSGAGGTGSSVSGAGLNSGGTVPVSTEPTLPKDVLVVHFPSAHAAYNSPSVTVSGSLSALLELASFLHC